MIGLKKIALIGLLFIFFGSALNAQTPLDTLVTKLNSDVSLDEKLDGIKKAANWLILNNPDTLVYYGNYALKMCETYEKSEKDKLFFLGILSETHFNLSNYSEALKYAFTSLRIAEKVGDTLEMANNHNSIGSIYRVSNKLDEAEKHFFDGLELRMKLNDSLGIASSYNNIGILYMMAAKYDTGMTYWGNSLEIKLAIGDSIGAATTMNNMAMYYRDIGETQKALDYFFEVIRIKKRINAHASVSMAYQNLGELYLKKGDVERGIDFYKQALEESKLAQSKQLISWNHRTLALVYADLGRYKEAFENFQEYSNLKDSIFSEETINNLNEVESKYQNEKKALIIKNLEQEKEAQAEKQQLIIISGGSGLLALLIIIFIVTKNYRQKKKDHSIISEQKNILFEKNKEITDSITYARRLQEAILPPEELINRIFPESFVIFLPKDVVSGDFYWLYQINKEEAVFAVADCTGHGVPGAMVSVVCSNALNRTVKEFGLSQPAEILNKTRELVIETFEKSTEDVKDGMDISLCHYNFSTKKLQYAGANNPLWLLRKGENDIHEIKADKQPIGVYHDVTPYTNHELVLNEGDCFYLFSDGFADQFGGEKGKKLKYKPFKNMLISNASKPCSEQANILTKEFQDWRGSIEQIDDVCVMGIRS